MKLKDLTENKVVQTTAENDLQFRELLDKEGFEWGNSESYLDKDNFGIYETMCYDVSKGEFCNKEYYQKKGYQILQASDFLTKKIKKSELLNRIEVLENKVAELEEKSKVTIENEVENSKRVKLEQPQFEVGKVYKGERVMFYCTRIKNNEELYGFGFNRLGEWSEESDVNWVGDFTEATPEEWFKRLEEEANRRYPKGCKIKCLNGWSEDDDSKWYDKTPSFRYDAHNVKLWAMGINFFCICVMDNGKWAEIIEEPKTMTVKERDELAKPFNPDEYKIGTIGIFWDGDFEEQMSKNWVIFGELDHITENGHFRRKGASWSWYNFKPIKID